MMGWMSSGSSAGMGFFSDMRELLCRKHILDDGPALWLSGLARFERFFNVNLYLAVNEM
jgi:hypothetical protein